MDNKWTGERLETFVYTRDTIEHLHRYALVKQYIENCKVLDIACGEGYGSNLMAQTATQVFGVDIDEKTIKKAKKKYIKNNLEFLLGSAFHIPLNNNSIDVVVSFETIEHHDKHSEMMSEIKRILKPNGILIISTPDKLYYSDKRNFKNEFHKKELYKKDFAELLSVYFKNIQLLTQNYIGGNSIIQDDLLEYKTKIYTGKYAQISESDIKPLYLIGIVSDIDFKKQDLSIFDGGEIFINQFKNQIQIILNSPSFRLGHFMLFPLKFLRKVINR